MLLNPKKYRIDRDDQSFQNLVEKTIAFFESKGLKKIKEDDQAMVWYEDFLTFIKDEKVFATLLTPEAYGGGEKRWDMRRISEFNEILGFYGLCYWYAWQVTILGLGPIWMGSNEAVKKRTAHCWLMAVSLPSGSRRKPMGPISIPVKCRSPPGDGTYLASGSKYYIGNGNCAALVSTFGKMSDGRVCLFCCGPGTSAV